MQDISFDLETLGLKQDAMILAIGAAKFDRETGEIGETFYQAIDIKATVGGGTIDASTVYWWMNQPAAARSAIFDDTEEARAARLDLRHALVAFSEFIGFNDELPEGEFPDVTLWQRGDKDGQWLQSAYEGMGLTLPFRYCQLKDERTLTELFKPIKPTRYGVHHNALDDAIYQAQCLVNVFARLNSVGAFVGEVPVLPFSATPPSDDDVLGKTRESVLSMAYVCGLETVGEAIANVALHATQIWSYAEIPQREKEVEEAFADFTGDERVVDCLHPDTIAKLDQELEDLSKQEPDGDEPDFPPAETLPVDLGE